MSHLSRYMFSSLLISYIILAITLKDSDYYIQKKKGFFLYDQAEKVILHRGDSLMIPDSSTIATIHQQLKSTIIDLNIPEFTLHLIQLHDTILTCQVRVGRN
jgi:hypothetical protein